VSVVGTALVGAVLVVWLVASTIHQFSPPWWGRYRRFDRMRLLPRWNFFAPRPGRRDQHLVYRDTVDGVPGAWYEIDTGRSPPVTRWLVNPTRFRQKAMIDLVNRLFTARRELITRVGDEQGLQLSSGYLAILTWAMAQPAVQRPCQRQFAVVATVGHAPSRELRLLFVSSPHRLEPEY
jgi:hypothetical protein